MAEERKKVLECQPILESMVGSPLVVQELTKVRRTAVYLIHRSKCILERCVSLAKEPL